MLGLVLFWIVSGERERWVDTACTTTLGHDRRYRVYLTSCLLFLFLILMYCLYCSRCVDISSVDTVRVPDDGIFWSLDTLGFYLESFIVHWLVYLFRAYFPACNILYIQVTYVYCRFYSCEDLICLNLSFVTSYSITIWHECLQIHYSFDSSTAPKDRKWNIQQVFILGLVRPWTSCVLLWISVINSDRCRLPPS